MLCRLISWTNGFTTKTFLSAKTAFVSYRRLWPDSLRQQRRIRSDKCESFHFFKQNGWRNCICKDIIDKSFVWASLESMTFPKHAYTRPLPHPLQSNCPPRLSQLTGHLYVLTFRPFSRLADRNQCTTVVMVYQSYFTSSHGTVDNFPDKGS